MKKIFPQVKKKVSAFLLSEDGKISKKDIVKAGVLVTGMAVSFIESNESVSALTHTNNFTTSGNTVTHSSHGSHGSHGSHSSHSSHGSHGSHGQW